MLSQWMRNTEKIHQDNQHLKEQLYIINGNYNIQQVQLKQAQEQIKHLKKQLNESNKENKQLNQQLINLLKDNVK